MLVQSRTHSVEGTAFRRAIEDVVSRLRATGSPARSRIRSPANADQISADGRSAVVTIHIDTTSQPIGPVMDAVAAAKAAHPELFIGGFGEATANKEIGQSVSKDLGSVPVTIVVLLVAFGRSPPASRSSWRSPA